MAAEEAVAAKGTVTWRLAAMAAAARRRQYDDGGATATASISWGDKATAQRRWHQRGWTWVLGGGKEATAAVAVGQRQLCMWQ